MELKKCTGMHIIELYISLYEKYYFTFKKKKKIYLFITATTKQIPLLIIPCRPNTSPNVGLDRTALFLLHLSVCGE